MRFGILLYRGKYLIVCYLRAQLTTNYGQSGALGQQATLMLDKFDWYFIPMMNPDGYNFTKQNVSSRISWPINFRSKRE